ncbi:adenosylcobinamide amidohydrolase [Paenibacillus alvei]|uniref:Adenosylcobinamide amidohydrolase n=1 Tax=Paenibacillus alvei TaxID=44250 RepID=A0AAP7A2X7_PAEAL|nr:adenosylcobinamide amidohydrolase [Paenibacillus alvei]NOJ71867.1 adenosylcobinamide amidohydrolase [Paenibacillus alvei]
MQPYREGKRSYLSQYIAGVHIHWEDAQVAVELPQTAPIWSSAVYHGGQWMGNRILNQMVHYQFDCTDPAEYLRLSCMESGYVPEQTVGLLTAAKVSHASVVEQEADECSLLCITTAGTSNAARSGMPRLVFSAYESLKPGTINSILVLDGKLSNAAILNLFMTATEAKCAALSDLGIIDAETGRVATGTTTDAIALAVLDSGRYEPVHNYAGTATTLGHAVGQLVYNTVYESVKTQHEA